MEQVGDLVQPGGPECLAPAQFDAQSSCLAQQGDQGRAVEGEWIGELDLVGTGLGQAGHILRAMFVPDFVTETFVENTDHGGNDTDRGSVRFLQWTTDPDQRDTNYLVDFAILLRDTLPGASELVKPPHFAVANAIGAAIAQVGGEVDKVVALEGTTRDAALEEAKEEAVEKAIAAGAERDTVRAVDVEDVPITYLPGNAMRIRVKAVGELDLGRVGIATGG